MSLAHLLAVAISAMGPALAAPERLALTPTGQIDAFSPGSYDFDFLVGEWRVHHRQLKERWVESQEWVEFDGICTVRILMGGAATVEDHLLNPPSGAYRAVNLHSYDAGTGQWALWWLDGHHPLGPLDAAVKGRFEHGVGRFFSEVVCKGKPVRVRCVWSHVTRTSACWEQAFSPDEGKTWETNWTMDFRRVK